MQLCVNVFCVAVTTTTFDAVWIVVFSSTNHFWMQTPCSRVCSAAMSLGDWLTLNSCLGWRTASTLVLQLHASWLCSHTAVISTHHLDEYINDCHHQVIEHLKSCLHELMHIWDFHLFAGAHPVFGTSPPAVLLAGVQISAVIAHATSSVQRPFQLARCLCKRIHHRHCTNLQLAIAGDRFSSSSITMGHFQGWAPISRSSRHPWAINCSASLRIAHVKVFQCTSMFAIASARTRRASVIRRSRKAYFAPTTRRRRAGRQWLVYKSIPFKHLEF